jgi:toxin ParE1/3/4
MKRPSFSPKALADLDEILDFIARDKPYAARKFVSRLVATCRQLAKTPFVGSACDHLSPGLRGVSHKSYVIYFRPTANEVRIERVIHSVRDSSQLFIDDDAN